MTRDILLTLIIAMLLTAHVIIVIWFIRELGYRQQFGDYLNTPIAFQQAQGIKK